MEKEFRDLIFYEIYPNSFKDSDGDGFGDLNGIISKLEYVKSLGFNAIWLNPCYESPFKDGGYDITDPFKIDKRYGTNKDMQELFTTAHSLGIIVFMDLVPGHVSTENSQFVNSGKGYKNADSDLFIWNDNVWNLEPGYRMISGMFDRDGCYMVNFFAHQPAINYGFNKISYPSWQRSYKEVSKGKEFLESIMKFWLDMGCDGFRVDMADSLVKNDSDKSATIWLWQTIRKDLEAKGVKKFYMTSEWSNPKQALAAGFDSDFVLDHFTNFSHFLFRQNGFNEHPLLMKYDEALYFKFIHDVNMRVGAAKKLNRQISVISGNHDTWRLANFLSGTSLWLAYLFILTMPGVPYIYYGDELGFHTDTSMPSFEGGYQRTGSRLPMKFDSSKNAGFSTADKTFLPEISSDLNVEEASKDPDSLLNNIKKLIEIRKNEADIRSGDFAFLGEKMSYRRGKIRVFINLLDEKQKFASKDGMVLYHLGEYSKEGTDYVLMSHSGLIVKEKRHEDK